MGVLLDYNVFECLPPGDVRHLSNPLIRLIIRRVLGFDITPALTDLEPCQLLELELDLWIYGGAYWRDVVDLIHKRLTWPAGSLPRAGGDLFERAKALVLVEDFAGRFTELVASSSNRLRGLCPLHDERTGSFVVYVDSQTWHCFGACGAGGDVVELGRRLLECGRW